MKRRTTISRAGRLTYLLVALASLALVGCADIGDDGGDWDDNIERDDFAVEAADGDGCWTHYYTATCGGVTGRGRTRAAAMESIAVACYEYEGGVVFGSTYVNECPESNTEVIYSKGGLIEIELY